MADHNSNSGNGSAAAGRKVFFLYPHSVMQDQLLQLIFQAEYEVYLLRDHEKARGLLAKFPDSILFVNIDERVRDFDWFHYVRTLMDESATSSVKVGILSYNEDPQLARRYLMELSVPCGFVKLKIGLAESARILLSVLEANEAKGQRRHVRALIPDGTSVTFSIKTERQLLSGRIRDISLAGMACYFDDTVELANDSRLNDLQLNLRGGIARVVGRVAGSRKTPEGVMYVILFEIPDLGETKRRLHAFIYNTLQSQMDRMLQAIT